MAALAARQHGNVTVGQLHAAGLTKEAILHRVRAGRLFREHTGVYSVGRPAKTALERASAAVLACGKGAALSHRSALCLWGFAERWHAPPYDVIATTDRRPKGINVHVCRGLTRTDLRTHHGIRVTSPARTILDNAAALPQDRLRRIVNDKLRTREVSPAALADVLARFPLHRGTKLLRAIVDDSADGLTDSEFEDEFRPFCPRHGLPVPEFGLYIAGHRTDAVFKDAKLIVECDGWTFHKTRERFERDRDRDADTLAAGYATVRITKRRIRGAPEREAARLRKIVRQRTGGG
ncbi:MAG: type IV toxin-antitoxin system AbiEi family antitoxin domain-containing protein [Solirubrobacterales bacterium]|nr:type IV toxin-antitoxin system AbiEi family antitoxin domain-containing protein [Solirubrobacterales bacterium]